MIELNGSPASGRRIGSLLLSLLVIFAAGCNTPIGVREVGADRSFRQVTASALRDGVPSHYSVEALATYGLQEAFYEDPESVLAELFERCRRDKATDVVYALAELSYLVGKRHDDKRYYLGSAFFSYLYLFHPLIAAVRQPFDPRFRSACDLYNRAVTEVLRTPQGAISLASNIYDLPFGKLTLKAKAVAFPWGREDFSRFLPASDFLVRGLRSRYRNPGLGVPLIAVRTPKNERTSKHDSLLPDDAKVAATAFLRFDLVRDDVLDGKLTGTLEVYAPFNVMEIEVEGQKVPLEADLTAPLAYGLQEGRLFDFELAGFLSGASDRKLGIFMMQPYSPGKIPVVFVHGTASSPARWAEMFNALQGYDDLRAKYQFMFFQYTTGNPIIYSAQLLREALDRVVETLDPDGTDPALREMVVVGHSQGGLLTRLQIASSGDRIWKSITDEPFDSIEMPEAEKTLLRNVCFFEPVPYVKRVIYIATPHRGSFLADTWYGRLAASFITMPQSVTNATRSLLRSTASLKVKRRLGDTPTSLRNMEPNGRFVKVLATLPMAPNVPMNSICAIAGGGKLWEENDGVVEYKSAHLDGAESEFLVGSPHSCQDNPLTIIEVRRILREHLKAVEARASKKKSEKQNKKVEAKP